MSGAPASASFAIRRFDAARDAAALRACFIALQDHEHALAPTAPTGEAIADEYLRWMFERCARFAGEVWVAAPEHGPLVGFATVLARVPRSDPDDPLPSHALLSELTVDPVWRGRGLGRRLLRQAERRATECGAPELRIGVFGGNERARRWYAAEGYGELIVVVGKRLRSDSPPL